MNKLTKEEVALEIQTNKPHVWIVLSKMCELADVDIATVDFFDDRWWCKSTMTRKASDDLLKWLTEYLYNDKDARRELVTFSSKNKKMCKEAANAFICWYGFKIEEDE